MSLSDDGAIENQSKLTALAGTHLKRFSGYAGTVARLCESLQVNTRGPTDCGVRQDYTLYNHLLFNSLLKKKKKRKKPSFSVYVNLH